MGENRVTKHSKSAIWTPCLIQGFICSSTLEPKRFTSLPNSSVSLWQRIMYSTVESYCHQCRHFVFVERQHGQYWVVLSRHVVFGWKSRKVLKYEQNGTWGNLTMMK